MPSDINLSNILAEDKFRLLIATYHNHQVCMIITKDMLEMNKPSWIPADGTSFKRYKKDSTTEYVSITGLHYYPGLIYSFVSKSVFTEFPWRDNAKNMCVVLYQDEIGRFYLVPVQVTDDTGVVLDIPQTNPTWGGSYSYSIIKEV